MILAYYGIYKREGEESQSSYDIKVKIHLPQTTKKLKIVIEKERNYIVEATRSDAQNTNGINKTSTKDSNYVAGVNYQLFDNKYWKTDIDSGMKILLPTDPFIKITVDKQINSKILNVYMGQRFVEYRQAGFSELTQLSFTKSLGKFFGLGQSNTLTWTDENDTFNLRNSLSLSHAVSDKVSMSYTIGANAKLSPTFYYTGYDASIGYRQLVHKKWLYLHVSTGADFPKDNDFKAKAFVTSKLEIFFR